MSISVPIQIKRRKRATARDPAQRRESRSRTWEGAPTPLQLALAHGHRWLAMIGSGVVKSLREFARKEGVGISYVSRMVNLTTVAPVIVAAILDETLRPEVTLFDLALDPPVPNFRSGAAS